MIGTIIIMIIVLLVDVGNILHLFENMIFNCEFS